MWTRSRSTSAASRSPPAWSEPGVNAAHISAAPARCDSTGGMVMRSARLAGRPGPGRALAHSGPTFPGRSCRTGASARARAQPGPGNRGGRAVRGFGRLGVRHVRRTPRLAEPPGHEPGPARPGHRDGAGPRAGTARLRAKGCVKINLLIEPGERGRGPLLHAARFPVPQPDLHGQVDRRCVPRPRRAAERGPGCGHTRHHAGPGLAGGPGATAGPGRPPAGAVTGQMWTDLKPALYPEPYVFATNRAAPGHRTIRGRPRGRRPHASS